MTILEGLKIIDSSGLPHPEWEFVQTSKDLNKFYDIEDYVGWTIRTVKVEGGPWKNIYDNWLEKEKVPETIDDFQKQHTGQATFVVYPSWKWIKGGNILIEKEKIIIEVVEGAIVNLMRHGKLDASYEYIDRKLVNVRGNDKLLNEQERDMILQAADKLKQKDIMLEWGFTTNNNFIFYRIEHLNEAAKLLIDKYSEDKDEIVNKTKHKTKSINLKNLIKIDINGSVAYPGEMIGEVVIIKDKNDFGKMKEGTVLVTPFTTPDFVPILKKCSAVITDLGGITSHAAIVCREIKTPCVVGTNKATQIFKDGDVIKIQMDNNGLGIYKID